MSVTKSQSQPPGRQPKIQPEPLELTRSEQPAEPKVSDMRKKERGHTLIGSSCSGPAPNSRSPNPRFPPAPVPNQRVCQLCQDRARKATPETTSQCPGREVGHRNRREDANLEHSPRQLPQEKNTAARAAAATSAATPATNKAAASKPAGGLGESLRLIAAKQSGA